MTTPMMKPNVTLLAALLLAPLAGLHAVEAAPIVLRDLPLLFADDSGIAAKTGVTRTVHAATTRKQPVLEPDQPWEGQRVYIYGSVALDEPTGQLRMWYMAAPNYVLHAISTDGVRWIKQPLGLHDYKGSTANNIVHRLHSPSVLFDPGEPDAQKRWKMAGAGYDTAWSADGLRWTPDPKNPVIEPSPGGDTITLARHPVTGEYLAYHKRYVKIRGLGRRTVWLARSPDFRKWSKPEMVFTADETDDAWAVKPDQRTEVYNLSVYPHAAGFLGLPTLFRVTSVIPKSEAAPLKKSPHDGPIDVQLVTSVDGVLWQRSEPRLPVIPRGEPGTFDGGAILGVSSTATHLGDKTWVYYTAMTTTHGAPIPPKRMSIGRAEWRRHGFVSLDAEGQGQMETKPLRLAAPNLVINADAQGGELRAALLETDGRPIRGFTLGDSVPLQCDATRSIARWKSGANPPTDRPVRVRLELNRCHVFSLSTDLAK
jgi:hypothetical protein